MTMNGAPVVERADVEHPRHVLALDAHRGPRLAEEALRRPRRSAVASGSRNLRATR